MKYLKVIQGNWVYTFSLKKLHQSNFVTPGDYNQQSHIFLLQYYAPYICHSKNVFDWILTSFWQLFANFSQSENENCQGRKCQIISPFTPLGFYRSHNKWTILERFFASFLLENVSYNGFVSSIKKYCSSLALLDEDKITLTYGECLSNIFFFGVLANAP